MNSINTNVGAMQALQMLNATSKELNATQARISSGLKIASAKDDASGWVMAQGQRAQIRALDAVKESLSRNGSVVDVAMTAGESISDLLMELKEKALAASDPSLNTTARRALNDDFVAIRNQIAQSIRNATFNGVNLLNGSRTSIAALANADGSDTLTVMAQNLSLGGSILTLSSGAGFASAMSAQGLIATLDSSISNISVAMARLGASSRALDRHTTFIGKLQDTLEVNVGRLVDADMAKESSKLQALQLKQQLAIQTLSVANRSQSFLLQLFGR
ncbi:MULTISPECIES: flagellin [Asticcacaulis]|uniref:Flagellin n=1 Tax=Asticcacaulis excentricus TaxID=78587 RepID=A0A3G9G769_9CAUL|nr:MULTISPECIES: flagellin [Asticcacaulis]MCA1935790.1 flagellin [Asticcacaulis sp.]BBF80089.1 flagellin protein FlaA [Asticcacaulis excentricus]